MKLNRPEGEWEYFCEMVLFISEFGSFKIQFKPIKQLPMAHQLVQHVELEIIDTNEKLLSALALIPIFALK